MVDTTIRKLLIGGNEEDFKVGVAIAARKGLVKEGLYAFEDVEKWTKIMELKKVQFLQLKYSQSIISGSIGLFLHGCRSNRWEGKSLDPFDGTVMYRPDIDIILPYYTLLEGEKIIKCESGYSSGNDFDEQYTFDDISMDVRVDPKQKYEIIKYEGFDYKVSDILDIISAKIKYSKQGSSDKHKKDLYDIMGKTTFGDYLKKVNSSKTELIL